MKIKDLKILGSKIKKEFQNFMLSDVTIKHKLKRICNANNMSIDEIDFTNDRFKIICNKKHFWFDIHIDRANDHKIAKKVLVRLTAQLYI